MKGARTAVLVLCLTGLLGGLDAQDGPAATPGEATRAAAAPAPFAIGVVDFVKVLEAYPRAIKERKLVDEFAQQRRAIVDAEERKAQEIKLKRDDFQPGTFERDCKEHELRLKLQDIEGMRVVFDRELRRKIDDFYTSIYESMQRAVNLVAKERGVSLVLRAHPDSIDGSVESKARVFEARVVWFAAAEIDLTAAVIQRLQVELPPVEKEQPKEGAGAKPGN